VARTEKQVSSSAKAWLEMAVKEATVLRTASVATNALINFLL
jgi:hypothetical protein